MGTAAVEDTLMRVDCVYTLWEEVVLQSDREVCMQRGEGAEKESELRLLQVPP